MAVPANLTLSIVIPTFNAERFWPKLSSGLRSQTAKIESVLVVDSSSVDNTADLARSDGFGCLSIEQSSFNHGGTRQMALDRLVGSDLIVFLTQDVVIADSKAISNLAKPFHDPQIGASFGRQLPRADASPIEAHARLFNYPNASTVRSFADRQKLGFKTIFLSNSFACYRRAAVQSVGGFRRRVLFGEDTLAAAAMLRAGWKISYAAEAEVAHSHNFTVWQEFRRYFDIGALHSMEKSLVADFGEATGEGKRFVLSELRYLSKRAPHLIPLAVARTVAKASGYRAGRYETLFARALKRRLSLQPRFWDIEKNLSSN